MYAVVVNQNMGAKPLALRSAISLAHLLLDEGDIEVAKAMLVPIYSWFTEGLETASRRTRSLADLCQPDDLG